MLRHAEWLAVAGDGALRESYNRVAAYFVTKIKIEGDLGDDEKSHKRANIEVSFGDDGPATDG